MEIRLPHKHFDIDHLNKVIAEMLILGPPQIKAVNCGEYYVALEGSHRLRAAKVLGISPIIEEIKYTEELTMWKLKRKKLMNKLNKYSQTKLSQQSLTISAIFFVALSFWLVGLAWE